MKSNLLKKSFDEYRSHRFYYFALLLGYIVISGVLSFLSQLPQESRLGNVLGFVVSIVVLSLAGFLLRAFAYKQVKPDIRMTEFIGQDVTISRIGRLAWKQILLVLFTLVMMLVIGLMVIFALSMILGTSEFHFEYSVTHQSSLKEIMTFLGYLFLALLAFQLLAPYVRSLTHTIVYNVRQGFFAGIAEAISITNRNYFYLLWTMIKIFLTKTFIIFAIIAITVLLMPVVQQMGEVFMIISLIIGGLVFLLLLIPLYIWEQVCYARAYVGLLDWDETK